VIKALRKAYDQWWKNSLPLMVQEDLPYSETHPQEVRYEKQLDEKGIPNWTPPEL